ncbi:MAG TPA: CsbD family protein [Vitreimonas sp.]|uniref:CsbD family protein n=1 Tax=Vitreimonas sp. TaxID=3069702 RepID=UPI002D6B08CF|nr:CsbD family protein [Vitreimonas sp.]HYD87011.1 CsbD family protein [Vitreimonas sp.]
MDKEHVKGARDKTSGAIKEGIGNLTDDTSMKVKGKLDKAKGEGHEALGDVKDAARGKDRRDDTRH